MRVLYLNHTALMSGGEHSLLTLMEGLPDEVDAVMACPSGPLAVAARTSGVTVIEVPGTAGSLRLHPVHTTRAVWDLARGVRAVHGVAKRVGAGVLHANTIRSGLVATSVSRLGGPPTVAHVRDRLPPGRVSDATLRILMAGARVVIANSRFTADRLPAGCAEVRVIPNPVDLDRFAPGSVDRAAARAELGIDPSDLVLAVIGQITPWKGQDLAVEVAGELASTGQSVRLLIVGSAKFTSAATRFDNRAFEDELHGLVERMDLSDRVLFLGEREDVPRILAATDLALVPSWEEPFGRAVIEAMAMGVPVIATEVGGPAEIIRDGVDGLLLPPRHPEVWVEAVRDLLRRPDRLAEMGSRGREQAIARFGAGPHVAAVLEAYGVAQSGISRLVRIRS